MFDPKTLLRGVMIALLSAAAICGQVGSTGEIRGTVTDPSLAIVPAAVLTAKDVATGIVHRAASGADGAFVFLSLLPGTYEISVTAPGFQTTLLSGVVVETGRTLDLPVRLTVGQTSETVEVKDVAQLLQTTTNQIATTVRNDYIQDLPFSGRDVLTFARLSAGFSQTAGGATTFDGLPTAALNISVDGININDTRNRSGSEGFSSRAPLRLDAIEELTVTTTGTGADAAAGGAMTIRFTTRRGSSQYHGRLFEQFQNDALNAGEFFNNMRGLRKTKVRLNDFGGNFGGPLKLPFLPALRNKLFFFLNYEDAPRPGSINPTATLPTAEAQSGIYRFVGTDGQPHTTNVLQLAGAAGYQSTLDPTVANAIKTIDGTLSTGVLTPSSSNLFQQTLTWRQDRGSRNIYPTARLDYQIANNLAWHGSWNLQHNHQDGNAPAYPGLPLNSGESKFTNYALSNGADWTVRPTMLNSLKFGIQSSVSINNLRNSIDQWAPQNYKRVTFGSGIASFIPNATPLVRTNPAYTFSDELNWVKGKHTLKFGGNLLFTRFFESDYYQFSGVLNYTLGVAAADPINSVFTAANIPFLRTQDVGAAAALYATLTGRVSNIRGFRNIDETARQYVPFKPLVYRESYTSWGLYFQDSYRMNPRLTLNYGLRWEFTGFMNNTNNTFMSPTYGDVLSPSSSNFQPGVLKPNAVPAIAQRSQTYAPDKINPAPNFGFAWNPRLENGFLRKLLGANGKTVIRGSYGLNYFDEGLNVDYWVNTNAGNWQSVLSQPGFAGFAPGGLTLQSPDPPFQVSPEKFNPPFPETIFAFGGYNIGTNAGQIRGQGRLPVMRNPYVQSWSLGIQREIVKDTVLEVRYVGNKTTHKWHLYGLQETNVFENGFLKEFVGAQNNLAVNSAAGVNSFQNRGLAGQVALPIFEAAFGARGAQPALAAAQGFTSATFINQLRLGNVGSAAASLAGGSSSVYFCRLVGNSFSPCADLGFNAAGSYPINFFRPNPYADDLTVTDDNSFYSYHAMQVDLRRSYRGGLTLSANYTLAHGLGDLFVVSNTLASGTASYYATLRNRTLDKGPSPFDVRHVFQTYWSYDLPFGRGRRFAVSNGVLDRIVGGWAISGIYRLTSGRVSKMTSGQRTFNALADSGVVLNGLTLAQLQEKLKAFSDGPNFTLYSADRSLAGADGRANPQFLSLPATPGQFGQFLYPYGPNFFSADMAAHKEVKIRERLRFNFQAEFLNFLNHPVFNPGSYNINSTTFGQTTSVAVGARNIQLRAYLSW